MMDSTNLHSSFHARFDDCEVILPSDPRFDAELPGWSSEVRRNAQTWARDHGFALLSGVYGTCPHVLMNEQEFSELASASLEELKSEGLAWIFGHVTSGSIDGKNCNGCIFKESLDHASFWVSSRWPTDAFMLWFPYGDPAKQIPHMARSFSPLMTGLAIETSEKSDHDDPGQTQSWNSNWYGGGTYRVMVKSGAPLGLRESLMLKAAWQHAELKSVLRSVSSWRSEP